MGSHPWSLARRVGALGVRRPRSQILVLLEAGLLNGSGKEPRSKANGIEKETKVILIDHSII